jgi:ADP-ribose pyrophosphatase
VGTRTVTRRVLHTGKVGVFGLETVELPSGHVTTLEMLRHPGAAAVVPFVDEDARRILLLRQYRYAVGGWLWEVPAGKLDPGEEPAVCARRELEEETGYRAGRMERTGEILTAPGFTDERIHLFCAYELAEGTQARGPGEIIELHERTLDEAMAMVESGEIVDAKTIVALWHARRRLSRD